MTKRQRSVFTEEISLAGTLLWIVSGLAMKNDKF